LPQALEILGRCEAFEQAAKGELQSIDLRIGATLTISDYLMPDLMATSYNIILSAFAITSGQYTPND
jgi:DNA-binding transcriptional LysR family regulator